MPNQSIMTASNSLATQTVAHTGLDVRSEHIIYVSRLALINEDCLGFHTCMLSQQGRDGLHQPSFSRNTCSCRAQETSIAR